MKYEEYRTRGDANHVANHPPDVGCAFKDVHILLQARRSWNASELRLELLVEVPYAKAGVLDAARIIGVEGALLVRKLRGTSVVHGGWRNAVTGSMELWFLYSSHCLPALPIPRCPIGEWVAGAMLCLTQGAADLIWSDRVV